MDWFIEFGFIGMFAAAFLAATILPLGSELVLSGLLIAGQPVIPLVLIATVGNTLGSLSNYGLGYWANKKLIKKFLGITDEELQSAESRFQKYGLASLCFAWVPIIGDPLTIIAGILRVPLKWFVLLVGIGKFLRYSVLAYLLVVV